MAIRLRKPGAAAAIALRAYGKPQVLNDVAEVVPAEGDEPKKVVVPEVKWINVANEGEWEGHPNGSFKFDRKVFEAFVADLHDHPQFKAGEDGEGVAPVIPFDYEHVSELDPREGNIAKLGVPAPAWALDLQVRDAADGTAQLWAKAKLGPDIRDYIANDQYRSVSIAFSLDAVDPVTGKDGGPKITSIAFTNHPFLRDLAPLAASSRRTGSTLLMWYDQAGSVDQGMQYTRQCLGLGATADATQIKSEILKVAGFAATPETTPPGVDLADIFQGLRKIWGLSVTATVEEIVAEIDKAVAQMAVETAASSAANAAVTGAAAVAAPNLSSKTTPQETPTMSLSSLGTSIAKLLRAHGFAANRLLADDKDVEEAIEEVVEEGEASKKSVADLLRSLGEVDLDAALASIPALKGALASTKDLSAQLEEALNMNAEADIAASDADVAIAASSKYPTIQLTDVKDALATHRDRFIDSEVAKVTAEAKKAGGDAARPSPKALFDARKNGRRMFLSAYGVPPEGMEKLLKGIAAAPGGTQIKVGAQAPQVPVGSQLLRSDGGGADGSGQVVIDLRGMSGGTQYQRLLSWVSSHEVFGKLKRDDQHAKAVEIRRMLNAKNSKYVLHDTAA